MVTNQLGRPVSGDDFYDREKSLQLIWSRLEDGNNLLLLAPRRVGKTSLMTRLKEQAPAHNFQGVFLSVADITNELSFVRRLYDGVQHQGSLKKLLRTITNSALVRHFKRVRKFGIFTASFELAESAESQWTELGEALTKGLEQLPGQWLLLIDELPLFVLSLIRQDTSQARARHFLNWFRELRVGPNASPRIRWFLAGSIGLDSVTSRMKLGDTINDLLPITNFGPFTEDAASSLLDELGKTYRLSLPPDVKHRLLERTGWLIPYHVQLLFSELRTVCHDSQVSATAEAVDAAYDALLSPSKRNLFGFWEQRLTQELGAPDDRHALALLRAAALDPHGATKPTFQQVLAAHVPDIGARDAQLDYLLNVLQSDGYLVAEGQRYRFLSSLLREFWLRRVIGE